MPDAVRGLMEAHLAGADAAARRVPLADIRGFLQRDEVCPYIKESITAWLEKPGFVLFENRFVGIPEDCVLRERLARIGKPLDEDPEDPDANWLGDVPEEPGGPAGSSPEVILQALAEMPGSHKRALELEEDEGSRERIEGMILMVEHMIVKLRDEGELP